MRFSPGNHSKKYWVTFLIWFFMFSTTWADLDFGINKVRYHTDHQWKILETQHFEIYYYQGCEALARSATRYAENAFVSISQTFDFVPKTKIPLFIYGTPSEFQETNISPEFLPEGVGGFTEVFKNRIAVPMAGSYHEFEKVLHHELTHAFQYDLIYGEGWRSVNLFKAVFVPNWMMEGMAEWNARHLDSQGEMVLRDAVLNDKVMPLNLLESFEHFEQVYMAYKESQSVLDYISQVYGRDKVISIFKKMTSNQPPDSAVKNTLGISLDELYEHWHFYIKSLAWSRIEGMPSPERYGEVLRPEILKSAPSPDGIRLATLNQEELGILTLSTKDRTTLLNRKFETQGSGIAWSPDGKYLAYSAFEDGDYRLFYIDTKSRKIIRCSVSSMPLIYSPAWSPDQKYILFTGFDYVSTNLYRYEIANGHLEKMTDDTTTKNWDQYSQDNRSIYYVEEIDGLTSLKKIPLDDKGLPSGPALSIGKDLGTITSLKATTKNLYFTTDLNRKIFNLFETDLEGGKLTLLSNSFADILSAIPSPDEKYFYANVYQKSIVTLYSFERAKMENNPWDVVARDPSGKGVSYISDAFASASKIIPMNPDNNTASVSNTITVDKTDNLWGDKKTKTPPVSIPTPVAHLEITEASNIIQLEWPEQDNENETVDTYHIYRSTTPGSNFNLIGTSASDKHGKFVDYQVVDNGKYFYYVTAVNEKGESPPSPIVEGTPEFKLSAKDYSFSVSPDILLFLAGYDSSFGFVGGGMMEMSDYLGDHRLGILGDTIPNVRTGIETNYEFSSWRTTVDLDFYYYQNFFQIYDLQTSNIVDQYRNNENGFDLKFSYPIDSQTRIEYGVGTQRFEGSPLYLQFSEGLSNYSLNTDQWDVANYYRLSFVQDKRKGTQFWPSSGYALNFTVLQALPVLDANVSFANLLFETQVFADIGFLNNLVWANRLVGMTSQGPNPQTFFIGDDQPFQAYFTTIRGYGGSTFYGSNLALWNTELRYPIATNLNFPLQPLSFILLKDIELAGFMDTGVLADQIQDIPNSPVLSSIGAGIRFYNFIYQRALVMLRFDVAWRMDQSLPPTFHFNLAPMF